MDASVLFCRATLQRTGLWVVLLLGGISIGFSAHAEPKQYVQKTFRGSSNIEGPHIRFAWNTWVDVTPAQIKTRLMQWEKSRELLEKIVAFKLLKKGEEAATFTLEREAPFFMSNPTLTIIASFKPGPKESVILEWKMLSGTPKSFRKTWTLTPEAGGTRIKHTSKIELPFDPPDFVLPDPKQEIQNDVKRFQTRVGASKTLAATPAKNPPR